MLKEVMIVLKAHLVMNIKEQQRTQNFECKVFNLSEFYSEQKTMGQRRVIWNLSLEEIIIWSY